MLQGPFGFPYPLEPRLAAAQLLGQFVTALVFPISSVFFIIGGLGLLQQLANFSSKIPLLFLHPFVAHRLVLGRIRLYFASIQSHAAEFYRTRSQRQLQHLLKETLKRLKVNLAEIRNSTKVRLVAGSEHSKRHILDEPFLDLPRGKYPDAVSVNQYLRHHSGVVGRLAAIVLFVKRLYRP